MNISALITDGSESVALDSIMEITLAEYFDSTGYSSMTDCVTNYDADGNITGYTYTTDVTDADGWSYNWTDSYDANWKLTQSAYSDSTGYSSVTAVLPSYDADGSITGYTYTTSGTNPDGSSYTWTDSYDANGTLIQSAYSDSTGYNSVTEYLTSYDADGNITGYIYTTNCTDADGSSYSWTDNYDANWTLLQTAYSDSTGYSSVTDCVTSYDADGNIAGYIYTTDVTEADGWSYSWTDTYDANWTLTQTAYSDSTGYSSVTGCEANYDADGNVTGYTYITDVTNADGSSCSWTDSYDANWSLTQSAYSDSTGYSSVTDCVTSYDADGNVTGYTDTTDVTAADGSSYSWTNSYDENWTLTQSAYSDSTGYSSVTDILTSCDAEGNVTGYTYTTDVTAADGTSYSWTDSYDANWTLTQTAYSDSTGYSSVSAHGASYDADGNVTGYTYITDVTNADGSSCSWTDSYDANMTLTQCAYSDSTGYSNVTACQTITDANGAITGYTYTTDIMNADGSSYSWNDSYDANWTLTQSAYCDNTGYSTVTARDASYDADGTVTGYICTTDVTDADGSSYSWTESFDANGNLTQSVYSDSTGYSSVIACEASYDSLGNITGYTYTTNVTDAYGSSYSWTDSYDANWTLTQSEYSDGSTANSSEASDNDLGNEAIIIGVVDDFVFNTASENTDDGASDTYVMDCSGQYSPCSDMEDQSSSDDFVFDCTGYIADTVSLPDNSFI